MNVDIKGTEVRESVFKNYTVYVVEISMGCNENGCETKTIYPRFKDMLRVQEILDRHKIRINLPSLSK